MSISDKEEKGKYAVYIPETGDSCPVEVHRLEDMQKLVGGHIETVKVTIDRKEYLMIVNEDGIINELPLNSVATVMVYPGFIFGNVLIMQEGIVDGEPDIVGLPNEEAWSITTKINGGYYG